ncbi:hypothetical protein PSPTOT1_3474 [Pseudomonas syringae pv. tomato T1]|nr:hypothetical protein PSPTOT1_3474 [Pseudomonas syringae pv. tomato T1]
MPYVADRTVPIKPLSGAFLWAMEKPDGETLSMLNFVKNKNTSHYPVIDSLSDSQIRTINARMPATQASALTLRITA